jgi:hypothetical protein
MSVLEDTSRLDFPETEIYPPIDNLKELALNLIQGINLYMKEQNEWFDELNEEIDDGEDAYFNACNQEEREYDKYTSTL